MTKEEKREYNREYRKKNKKRIQEYNSEYRKRNKESLDEYSRNYYSNIDTDKRKGYSKEYRDKNKSSLNQYSKEYYANNKEYWSADSRKVKKRDYYEANKDKFKENGYKYRYGLSTEDVESMKTDQDNKCLICACDFDDLDSKHIHIDHNHETGAIRGVLCKRCNLTLGILEEDTQLMENMINYVNAYNKKDR